MEVFIIAGEEKKFNVVCFDLAKKMCWQSFSLIRFEMIAISIPNMGLIMNRLLTIAALPGANLIKDLR